MSTHVAEYQPSVAASDRSLAATSPRPCDARRRRPHQYYEANRLDPADLITPEQARLKIVVTNSYPERGELFTTSPQTRAGDLLDPTIANALGAAPAHSRLGVPDLSAGWIPLVNNTHRAISAVYGVYQLRSVRQKCLYQITSPAAFDDRASALCAAAHERNAITCSPCAEPRDPALPAPAAGGAQPTGSTRWPSPDCPDGGRSVRATPPDAVDQAA